jgi:hypothetical protein
MEILSRMTYNLTIKTKKSAEPDGVTGEFYKPFKELPSSLFKLFQK